MKWNVSVLRRSGECERIEVADFELSEFFNRIASAEGKAWVLSVERVGDVGDSALVEPDGDELVSQLGKRRWRVMGDPEDGWWDGFSRFFSASAIAAAAKSSRKSVFPFRETWFPSPSFPM